MRLVIASNRLPIVLKKDAQGATTVSPGTGGLVTALAPVLKNRGGTWFGWAGMADISEESLTPIIEAANLQSGFSLEPIPLTTEEVLNYYQGFSNEVIWPLFHDLQTHCNFVPEYWQAYLRVNEKFATRIAAQTQPDDFIWVHDYQLMLLGQELKKKGVKNRIGFFLHIPFPPLDIFLKLPWRFQLMRALLEFDVIGFQTMRDKRNFIQCLRTLLNDVRIQSAGNLHKLQIGRRKVRVGCFPISIDFHEFESLAHAEEVEKQAWYIHEKMPDRKLVLCVDRLDYTKGIPYRLEAFKRLLTHHPELLGKISLVQAVVPSRMDIPKYQDLKEQIDTQVNEINSQFSTQEWTPIQYMFRSLPRRELLAYYRTAEVAFVTPIKDGMNLVAKEYIASNIEENGVLILSEFAGATAQLHKNALVVNPYDVEGMARAIYAAAQMPDDERKERMSRMRRLVRRHDIYAWVRSFLYTAVSKELVDFPLVHEYIPEDVLKNTLDQELVSI